MDLRIGVELFDESQQLRFAGRRGKIVLDRVKPAGLRGLALGFDIDLTGRVFANEDNCQARLKAFRGGCAGLFRHKRQHPLRCAFAINQKGLRLNARLRRIERCLNNRSSPCRQRWSPENPALAWLER